MAMPADLRQEKSGGNRVNQWHHTPPSTAPSYLKKRAINYPNPSDEIGTISNIHKGSEMACHLGFS